MDGQFIKLFPNFIKFEIDSNRFIYNVKDDYADIYLYNGLLSYKNINSDTLFRLNDQLEFVPEVIFDVFGRKAPANMRGISPFKSMFTDITFIHELENYIVFQCNFGDITPKGLPADRAQICFYNKNSNELTIPKRDLLGKKPQPIAPNVPGTFINHNNQLVNYYSGPIINDIDGGYDLYILPSQVCFIQNSHQLLCKICKPFELLNDLNEKHFASKKIKNMEAHERLKNMLSNLDAGDNAVLMIATFK